MLRTSSELESYAISAVDGLIGHVVDVFIDDADWTVRWLVVETGKWLSSRKVLVSPMAVNKPDRRAKLLPVSITREQVKSSPGVDTHMPVNRQHEIDLSGYYGYTPYWIDDDLWGSESYANPFWAAEARSAGWHPCYGETRTQHDLSRDSDDPHLQSANELTSYQVHASDGTIGHVRDMFIEYHTWAVRYLVLETGPWWHRNRVLIPPTWINEVDWDASEFKTARTRQAITDAPAYDAHKPFDEQCERRVHDYFSKVA